MIEAKFCWQRIWWAKLVVFVAAFPLVLTPAIAVRPGLAQSETRVLSREAIPLSDNPVIKDKHKSDDDYAMLFLFLILLGVSVVAAYQVGYLRGSAMTPDEIHLTSFRRLVTSILTEEAVRLPPASS